MSVANELSAQAGFESIPYQEEIASAFCGADLSGEPNRALATFAGGCFWCMVAPFQQQPSAEQVVSGHTGGHEENPTYQQVADGSTGHFEAIQVTFD